MGLASTHFNKSACNTTSHRASELDGSLGTTKTTGHGQNCNVVFQDALCVLLLVVLCIVVVVLCVLLLVVLCVLL